MADGVTALSEPSEGARISTPRGLRSSFRGSKPILDALATLDSTSVEDLARRLGKSTYRVTQVVGTLTRLGLAERAIPGQFRVTRLGLSLSGASDPAYAQQLLRRSLEAAPDFWIYWSDLTRSHPRFGQTELGRYLTERYGFRGRWGIVYAGYLLGFARAAGLCGKDGASGKYVATLSQHHRRSRPDRSTDVSPVTPTARQTILDERIRAKTEEIATQLRSMSRLWNLLALYLGAPDADDAARYREQALVLLNKVSLGPVPTGQERHHELGRLVLKAAGERFKTELEAGNRPALMTTLRLIEKVLAHLETSD